MATLIDWFSKRDYEEGLILLATHSKNRMLIQNLTKKRHPGKLEYELKKIADHLKLKLKKPAPKVVKAAPPKTKNKPRIRKEEPVPEGMRELKIVRGKRVIDPDKLPADLKKLWDANRDSYKEIRALSEKLKLMDKASVEDRQPLTERMCKLDDFVRANWELIDEWDPDLKQDYDQQGSHEKIDHKRINANRKYISTNLKKLHGGMDAAKADILKDNLKIRYRELLEAGEKLTQETIDELTKAGVI